MLPLQPLCFFNSTRRRVAALLLAVGVGLASNGCGSSNASAEQNSAAKETMAGMPTGVLSSPLPPIKIDDKLAGPKQNILYGRVVIDGKPAKKGTLEVCAISMKLLENDPAAEMAVVPGNPKKTRTTFSADVSRDDGLYLIKAIPPGEYKVFCRFGPAFAGKEDRTIFYSEAVASPIMIQTMKGHNVQDVVMLIDTPVAAPAAK